MNTLIFGIVWTVLAAAMAVALFFQADFHQQPLAFRIIIALMPCAGILPVRDGLRRVRRFRSVRRESWATGPVFVWIEFDGSVKTDTTDPRPGWDAEDRDFSG